METCLPPVEQYRIGDKNVHVVRDDLGSPFPLPNNSKIRGIETKLRQLKEEGISVVASQDTSISRIGWGVSAIAQQLDMKHYNFYPEKRNMNFYQKMSKSFGGIMVPIHGTFSSGFRALCQRYLNKLNHTIYFLPIGVSMPEAVNSTAELISRMDKNLFEGTIITSVSSGTICAGLLKGLLDNDYLQTKLIGIITSKHNATKKRLKIRQKMRDANPNSYRVNWFSGRIFPEVITIGMGYEYKERETIPTPFPCDLYLDRKAWKFLVDNVESFTEPIVFWNIGGEWSPEKGLTNDLRGDGKITKEEVDKYVENL